MLQTLLEHLLARWQASCACLLVAFILVRHYVSVYNYWPKRGFKGEQPLVPFVSHLWNLFARSQYEQCLENTRKFGKIYGRFFMGRPCLMIGDPEVIKQMAVKDFDLFPNHNIDVHANNYQRNQLVWIQGDHWRRVRAMMTPTFTSGKIKHMFRLLDSCADDLIENLREQFVDARRAGERCAQVDLVHTYGLYTLDGITTCCCGIKLKREQAKGKVLKHKSAAGSRESYARDLAKLLKPKVSRILAFIGLPSLLLRCFNFKLVPEQQVKPIAERVQKMIEQRREIGMGQRKHDDLLQLLVDAKADDQLELTELDQAENHHAGLTSISLEQDHSKLKSGLESSQKTKLSDFEILAEAMLMITAGHETTRSSISTITYLLAHNPQVQQRLYEELKDIAQYTPTALGKHLVFDYDSLTSCKYLDAVISESLRFLAPALYTDRCIDQDYFIEKYGLTIQKGMRVLFSICSLHRDPDYWEEPDRFDPDRFMPGRKEKIVPGCYIPFSIGPRHCIGMRFSLTETKLGLAKAIMNFRFEPAPGTKYPPESSLSPGLFIIKNCKVNVYLRED